MQRLSALSNSLRDMGQSAALRSIGAQVLESAEHIGVRHDRAGGHRLNSFWTCERTGLDFDGCDCEACDRLAEELSARTIAEARRRFAFRIRMLRAELAFDADRVSSEARRTFRSIVLAHIADFKAANPREVQA